MTTEAEKAVGEAGANPAPIDLAYTLFRDYDLRCSRCIDEDIFCDECGTSADSLAEDIQGIIDSATADDRVEIKRLRNLDGHAIWKEELKLMQETYVALKESLRDNNRDIQEQLKGLRAELAEKDAKINRLKEYLGKDGHVVFQDVEDLRSELQSKDAKISALESDKRELVEGLEPFGIGGICAKEYTTNAGIRMTCETIKLAPKERICAYCRAAELIEKHKK